MTRPPTLAEPPALRMPAVQRVTLSSGLDVLLVEQKGLPVVDVQVIIRTGAMADTALTAGLTSLAVDMFDEGAAGRSAIEIAEAVEDLGASISSSAGWDDVGFGIHAHTARVGATIDILADIILRPAISAADFDRKKTQRLTALLQERDEPRALATHAFNNIVYGDVHPYGRPLHGTRASVESLTRDDVVSFHDRYIRPRNAFVVAVGEFDTIGIIASLEAAFGQWVDAPVPVVNVPDAPAPALSSTHIVDRPGSAQSELRIGGIGVARNTPDYFPILVMNTILGGSFTSRINLNLRQDKGYTYGAGSSFGFRLGAGPFVASSAVDTHVTADAIRQILYEIERIRSEPVPADELVRAASYIALGLPRTFETTTDIAGHLADMEVYHLGNSWFDDYVERLRAVTAGDVHRVAQQYLDPRQFTIALAGDFAAVQVSLHELGIGAVHKRLVEE